METRSKPGVWMWGGAALLICMGCGASTLNAHPDRNPALRTDGDRYSAAILEAMEAYEGDASQVTGMWFPLVDAEVAARVLSETSFPQHLRASLHRRGLTPRGMAIYEAHHPEFRAQLERFGAERLTPVRESVEPIARRLIPQVGWVARADEHVVSER